MSKTTILLKPQQRSELAITDTSMVVCAKRQLNDMFRPQYLPFFEKYRFSTITFEMINNA